MSNTIKVYEGDNYKFDVEDVEGFAFVHIRKWVPSLSAYRAANKLLPGSLDWLEEKGYDGLHAYTQNKKLMNKIKAFTYMHDIEDGEGGTWGFYKCHKQ